jgi:PST family polysaccharide transporter
MNEEPQIFKDAGTKDLGGQAVRGGAVVFGAMALQKILTLVVMAVLARLLTPEDYGLLGMVSAFVVILQLFSDLGLTQATVQKADITQTQVSTLFWLNLAFSGLLAAVMVAVAPAIVWFYREPRLLNIALWLAPSFIIAGLGTQHAALMQLRLRFERLAVCDILSLVAGAVAGAWMALKGLGVYALVGQILAQTGTKTALLWILNGWRPGLPARGCGTWELLRFGGYLTASNLVNNFSRNSDDLLLGRVWGAETLGLYSRASSLLAYPISLVAGPMGQVMIPIFSRLRNDKERFARAHLKAMALLTFLCFPLAGGLAMSAHEVIPVMMGARWNAAIPIFSILSISLFLYPLMSSMGWLYLATGKTDKIFHWTLFSSLIILPAYLIGLPYGARGVALACACANIILFYPSLYYATKVAGLSLKAIFKTILRPILCTTIMMAVLVLFDACCFLSVDQPWEKLAIKIALGSATYLLAVVFLDKAAISNALSFAKSLKRQN